VVVSFGFASSFPGTGQLAVIVKSYFRATKKKKKKKEKKVKALMGRCRRETKPSPQGPSLVLRLCSQLQDLKSL
jgi:hypothetical protein